MGANGHAALMAQLRNSSQTPRQSSGRIERPVAKVVTHGAPIVSISYGHVVLRSVNNCEQFVADLLDGGADRSVEHLRVHVSCRHWSDPSAERLPFRAPLCRATTTSKYAGTSATSREGFRAVRKPGRSPGAVRCSVKWVCPGGWRTSTHQAQRSLPGVLRKIDATITGPLAPSDTRDAVHREWASRPLGIAQGSDGRRQPASSVRLMPRGFPDLSWHADGPGCSG
jgi:hypothetical protein